MAGSIIPAVYSFRALEDNNVDRLKVLMKYWIIHALLLIVEVFVDVILFWVPMYSHSVCVVDYFRLCFLFRDGFILINESYFLIYSISGTTF